MLGELMNQHQDSPRPRKCIRVISCIGKRELTWCEDESVFVVIRGGGRGEGQEGVKSGGGEGRKQIRKGRKGHIYRGRGKEKMKTRGE